MRDTFPPVDELRSHLPATHQQVIHRGKEVLTRSASAARHRRVRSRRVTTVLLLRHGRSTANAGGVLAGWTPDVHLHEDGLKQAEALAERLAKVPLDRRRHAARSSAAGRPSRPLLQDRDLEAQIDERFGEVRYGDWTGVELKKLAKDPLWQVVQSHPSGMTFPGDGRRVAGGRCSTAR